MMNKKEKKIIIRNYEARGIAEYFCEPESSEEQLLEMLKALGLSDISARAVIPAWDDEDNMFEEFLESLGKHITIIP